MDLTFAWSSPAGSRHAQAQEREGGLHAENHQGWIWLAMGDANGRQVAVGFRVPSLWHLSPCIHPLSPRALQVVCPAFQFSHPMTTILDPQGGPQETSVCFYSIEGWYPHLPRRRQPPRQTEVLGGRILRLANGQPAGCPSAACSCPSVSAPLRSRGVRESGSPFSWIKDPPADTPSPVLRPLPMA